MMSTLLGILPTLILQIWTNTTQEIEISQIMSAAIVVKILIFLASLLEVPLMAIEMRMIRRLQEDRVHGYKPITETQKRAGFY